MSDPVLRCPNCGTTQATPGECEACHEAEVRWFCPNHTPGRWLDGPVCAECAARAARERAAPRAPPPRRAPSPPPSPPPSRSRTPATPHAGAPPPRGRRAASPPPPPPRARDYVDVPTPEWRPAPTEPPRRAPPVDLARVRAHGATLTGCIGRLLMLGVLVVVLVVVLFLGLFSGGGPFRDLVVDVGRSTGLVGGVPAQTLRGIEAYRAGDLETAERELEEAARTYRRSALALLYLARIRMDAGDLGGAGQYLEDAVGREPENALAHRELGAYHRARARRLAAQPGRERFAREELALADQEYRQAIALDPADRTARGYHACVLAELGETDAAATALAAAGPGPWDECAAAAPTR